MNTNKKNNSNYTKFALNVYTHTFTITNKRTYQQSGSLKATARRNEGQANGKINVNWWLL